MTIERIGRERARRLFAELKRERDDALPELAIAQQRVAELQAIVKRVPLPMLAATARAEVMVSVLHRAATDGRLTLDDLASDTGRSRSATYSHLRRLRRDGLVTWDEGRHGTLRPTVAVVVGPWTPKETDRA